MTTKPTLKEAATMALEALCMPCDRWNGTQAKIVSKAIEALRAALAVPDAELAALDGWKLVPVILTEEMTTAGRDAQLSQPCHMSALMVYRAMLAAAPQPAHVPEVGFGNIAAPVERKPLTDEKIAKVGVNEQLWFASRLGCAPASFTSERTRTSVMFQEAVQKLVRAIEAAHGIKGKY